MGKCTRGLLLFDKVFGRMEKNLNSQEEEVRAKAVTAIVSAFVCLKWKSCCFSSILI